MTSVSNGLYFLTLPLVRVMRVIYRKIRHAHYLYIKRNIEKVWGARYTLGARYLSKNIVYQYRRQRLFALLYVSYRFISFPLLRVLSCRRCFSFLFITRILNLITNKKPINFLYHPQEHWEFF